MNCKILEIVKDSAENENKIITAFMILEIGKIKVNVFVPRWSYYFPYHPKPSKYGAGKELIKNLTGKTIDAQLHIFARDISRHATSKIKKITQDNLSSYYTTVTGQVIDVKNYIDPEMSGYQIATLDCGSPITFRIKKDAFKSGDFLTVAGRLDASLIRIIGENQKFED